jgi:Fic family protein
MFDPQKSYVQLPRLPPPDVETRAVLRACAEARAALAAANTAALLLPNSSVLINTIPLLEAQASSEIENIVTTNDELFRQARLDDVDMPPATKEALRYRTALRQGFDSLQTHPLSVRTAVDVVRLITGVELDVRKTSGTTLRNMTTGDVIYTPPEGEGLLRDLLSNWEAYLHADDGVEPLVKLAVQHYQFEAIHPFVDGNGRAGRILNVLFLVQRDLLQSPILYMSRYILRERATYYRLLQDVTRDQAWEAWVRWFVDGVAWTASMTTGKIYDLKILQAKVDNELRVLAPEIRDGDLMRVIFTQPYCRIQDVVEAGVAKRQTASAYLQKLVSLGILEAHQYGRQKLFLNRRMLDVLTSPSLLDGKTKDISGRSST